MDHLIQFWWVLEIVLAFFGQATIGYVSGKWLENKFYDVPSDKDLHIAMLKAKVQELRSEVEETRSEAIVKVRTAEERHDRLLTVLVQLLTKEQ